MGEEAGKGREEICCGIERGGVSGGTGDRRRFTLMGGFRLMAGLHEVPTKV